MKEFFDHIRVGFCWWDAVALLAVLAVMFFMIARIVRAKQRKNELENEIAARSLDDSFRAD